MGDFAGARLVTALVTAVAAIGMPAAAASGSGGPGDRDARPEADHAYAFHDSALDGGGCLSVIDESADGTIIAGGDSQGFYRSTDHGLTWHVENIGLTPSLMRKVAAIVPVGGTTWYAGVGNGTQGGFVVSHDDGRSWTAASRDVFFDGGNVVGGPRGHPRSTGNLIRLDRAAGLIYAATYDGGVVAAHCLPKGLAPGRCWVFVAICCVRSSSMRSTTGCTSPTRRPQGRRCGVSTHCPPPTP